MVLVVTGFILFAQKIAIFRTVPYEKM